jgi:hypothetical protein
MSSRKPFTPQERDRKAEIAEYMRRAQQEAEKRMPGLQALMSQAYPASAPKQVKTAEDFIKEAKARVLARQQQPVPQATRSSAPKQAKTEEKYTEEARKPPRTQRPLVFEDVPGMYTHADGTLQSHGDILASPDVAAALNKYLTPASRHTLMMASRPLSREIRRAVRFDSSERLYVAHSGEAYSFNITDLPSFHGIESFSHKKDYRISTSRSPYKSNAAFVREKFHTEYGDTVWVFAGPDACHTALECIKFSSYADWESKPLHDIARKCFIVSENEDIDQYSDWPLVKRHFKDLTVIDTTVMNPLFKRILKVSGKRVSFFFNRPDPLDLELKDVLTDDQIRDLRVHEFIADNGIEAQFINQQTGELSVAFLRDLSLGQIFSDQHEIEDSDDALYKQYLRKAYSTLILGDRAIVATPLEMLHDACLVKTVETIADDINVDTLAVTRHLSIATDWYSSFHELQTFSVPMPNVKSIVVRQVADELRAVHPHTAYKLATPNLKTLTIVGTMSYDYTHQHKDIQRVFVPSCKHALTVLNIDVFSFEFTANSLRKLTVVCETFLMARIPENITSISMTFSNPLAPQLLANAHNLKNLKNVSMTYTPSTRVAKKHPKYTIQVPSDLKKTCTFKTSHNIAIVYF